MIKKICHFLSALALLCASAGALANTLAIPMDAEHWTTADTSVFAKDARFPLGVLEGKGKAVLKDVVFTDGEIAFDVQFRGGITTLAFRRRETESEAVVFRVKATCATSFECIQYTPVSHNAYLWDLYPQYQGAAPLTPMTWHHLRIVVAGRRMHMFLDQEPRPILSIDRLEGSPAEGGIRLSGPANWANLVITPTPAVATNAEPDRATGDARYLRAWEMAPPQVVPSHQIGDDGDILTELPSYAAMRDLPANAWQPLQADHTGLVNLSRTVGSKEGAEVTGVWLRTTLQAIRAQRKKVSIGWLREIVVYVNGRRVFAEKNTYGSPRQKAPDGRIGLQNGSVVFPLQKGPNRIEVFVNDNFNAPQHFGWGLLMRLAESSR